MKKDITTEESPEHIFSILLRQLSSPALRDFLEDTIRTDRQLLYQFIIHFIEQSDYTDEQKKQIAYESILSFAGYNKKIFTDELVLFTQRSRQFLEEKNFIDAFLSAQVIVSNFKTPDEESADQLEQAATAAFSVLVDISKSDAALDLKEKNWELLKTAARDYSVSYPGEVIQACFAALVEAADETEKLEWTLSCIADKIELSKANFRKTREEYDELFLLELRWQVLKKMNLEKEALQLLQENKRNDFFRMKLVESEIEQNNFSAAKELIADRKGVELPVEFLRLLLEIAQKENDVKAIRSLALQLFQSSKYDFEYFNLLKQQYDKSRWKQQVDRIVNIVKRNTSAKANGLDAAAKILIAEEEWDKLLRLVQKNANLEFVEEYAGWLKEKFPLEVLEVYRTAVRRYAEKHMGTEVYRTVTGVLRKMQSIPGGKEIVQALTIELKVTYRQRRSFVEELNKVVLS